MAVISIIVPVYNVEAYLSRCVDSLLNQTFSDFELVLVDDGSPDCCGTMCDEYAKRDRRVHVIHKSNGGLSDARNYGIDWAMEHSDSEWIGFVDSDDWVDARYLEMLFNAATEHGVDASVCHFAVTKGEPLPGGEITTVVWSPETLSQQPRSLDNVAWGKLYRKKYFQDIRYPVGRIHEDAFTTYKILYQLDRIAVIDQPLYAYFQNDAGIMRSKWTPRHIDGLDALEQQMVFFDQHGFTKALRAKFDRYIRENPWIQRKTLEAEDIEEAEKRRIVKGLKKQLRKVLIRYQRYGFASPFRRGDELWAYSNAFLGARVAHKMWHKLKTIGRVVLPVRWIKKKRGDLSVFREKVGRLGRYIRAARGCDAVLLQTPMHRNIGDYAIALAELDMLKGMGIACADVPWIAGIEDWCAAVTPRSKTVFITGGGRLGSLWSGEERGFRAALRAFSKHRIIVFPQTVFFDMETDEGRSCFEASREVYAAHPDLTIALREAYSLDFMRIHMPEIRTLLVPDMVMLMEARVEDLAREGVLLCLRRDKERTLTKEQHARLNAIVEARYDVIHRTDMIRSQPALVEERRAVVEGKLSEFASAELVITDRLHGMIFAAITQTPCIVLNSLSHKVRGCYEWLKDLDYIRCVDDIEAVPAAMKDLSRVAPKYNRQYIENAMKPLYDIVKQIV